MDATPLTTKHCYGGTQHSTAQIMSTFLMTEQPLDRTWIIANVMRYFGITKDEINAVLDQ